MNRLKRAERFIRRTALANLIGTNTTYLAVLAKKGKLTPEMDDRLKQAVGRVIKELRKLL